MKERLSFDHTKLSNGISCYFKPLDVDYTTIFLQVPVGSAHNTGDILPGSFHFLEHICFGRSVRHPSHQEFMQLVGSKGGWANAHTFPFRTTYEMSVPTQYLEEVIPGLVSMVFEPYIAEEDLVLERTIIDSERRQKRWYPASSELGQYLDTKWQWDQMYPVEQSLGGAEDLAKISKESLHHAHAAYFDTEVVAMGYGSGSMHTLHALLEKLEVRTQKLPTHYDVPRWVQKDYHIKAFRDVSRFELRYGGIILPVPDIRTTRQMSFIFGYLTNAVQGPLYMWLRKEKGWVYEIDFYFRANPQGCVWTLRMPLATADQVEVVRKEVWQRIENALQDEQAIQREVDRLIGSSVYWYVSPDNMIESGLDSLQCYGRIISMAEWVEHIHSCADSKNLQKVFHQYFSQDQIGSMCSVPEQ
jgi:predicted Zn-dependent peptidase